MAHQVGKLIWPRKANAHTISLFPTQTMAFFLYLRIESNKQKVEWYPKMLIPIFPAFTQRMQRSRHSFRLNVVMVSVSISSTSDSFTFIPPLRTETERQKRRKKPDVTFLTTLADGDLWWVFFTTFHCRQWCWYVGRRIPGGYNFWQRIPHHKHYHGAKDRNDRVCVYLCVCVNGGRSSSAPSDDSIALPNRAATGSEAAGMLGMLVRLKRAAGDSVCREVSNVREPPCAIWCLRDLLCKGSFGTGLVLVGWIEHCVEYLVRNLLKLCSFVVLWVWFMWKIA